MNRLLSIFISEFSEYISCVLMDERLKNCTQDEYACFRSTQWITQTKKHAQFTQNSQKSQM
ncbi:MAG: hypothetical protein LBB88_03525 [Planctomycetaceae bacterium]|nr:hypothetical protein [Planctomycetaceae bacterium]